MQRYLHALEQRLLYFARRAGIKVFIALVAGVLFAAGVGFLTHAVWLSLALALGPVWGAAVLGLGLIGVGGLLLLLGTIRKRTPPPLPPPAYSSPQSASIVALVEAFMVGLQAGKNTKGDRKD